LRSLVKLLADSGETKIELRSLETVEDDVLMEAITPVMRSSVSALSDHSIEAMTPLQQKRLEELLLSVSTAETMAEQLGRSAQATLSTALLRQLGITLIAWNFPQTYERAFAAVETSHGRPLAEFDSFIHSTLGFSPLMLATRIVSSWGVAAESFVELRESAQAHKRFGSRCPKGESESIAWLCEIGEAFARANAPERYPSARDDWSVAATAIESTLGSEGIKAIYSRVQLVAKEYSAACPALGDSLAKRQESVEALLPVLGNVLEQNIFLSSCDSELRQALIKVYAEKQSGLGVNELLRLVADQAASLLACESLTVFTLDPTIRGLVPVLARGRVGMIRLKAVTLLNSSTELHPVRLAFSQEELIKEQGGDRERELELLAGSIGFKRRVAVFVVEWRNRPLAALPEREDLTLRAINFQAVRKCLADILGLE
jgi:hypothetical protein